MPSPCSCRNPTPCLRHSCPNHPPPCQSTCSAPGLASSGRLCRWSCPCQILSLFLSCPQQAYVRQNFGTLHRACPSRHTCRASTFRQIHQHDEETFHAGCHHAHHAWNRTRAPCSCPCLCSCLCPFHRCHPCHTRSHHAPSHRRSRRKCHSSVHPTGRSASSCPSPCSWEGPSCLPRRACPQHSRHACRQPRLLGDLHRSPLGDEGVGLRPFQSPPWPRRL
mmetsp:Transcript_53961/g.101196  ORF Transcript_53961/g.101196 Transcript_53961/m.101196 type:complete len:221 (-) Transcript_53961:102-764(-)